MCNRKTSRCTIPQQERRSEQSSREWNLYIALSWNEWQETWEAIDQEENVNDKRVMWISLRYESRGILPCCFLFIFSSICTHSCCNITQKPLSVEADDLVSNDCLYPTPCSMYTSGLGACLTRFDTRTKPAIYVVQGVLKLRNEGRGTPKTPKGEHKHLMITAEVRNTMVSCIWHKLPNMYLMTREHQGHMTKSNRFRINVTISGTKHLLRR